MFWSFDSEMAVSANSRWSGRMLSRAVDGMKEVRMVFESMSPAEV
ncbi:MAG: hypothetical protein AVDCRST_MAG33-1960 [uncultured Thermomicrobiales bacterium]|uniref:Uncharacterized protein n=1 Tax=uncultured Thermomicrobiales bacterium TaxID=1645740 RepID=A0A6J4V538_9BACT|nr:MAG: hypothetical protein AVDCRST_MAG33-1960 [uncultured Thermomicrobiales bacterium]